MAVKPGWSKVKFGDVVRLSKERSSDPLADGHERYIGLEHIDSEDLRVRRWGNVADGVTFTSVFKPGQVLFGKRRAYQRKVAVADFAGVCSGDIYVLESKDPKRLLPELLPFICQTEAFFQHAVGTSAGSLSPRTNWTSLADFEFSLPPLEEQRRIVELLLSVEDVLITQDNALELARTTRVAYVEDFLKTNCNDKRSALGDYLIDLSYGLSSRSSYEKTGYPILRIPNVLRGNLDFSDLQWIELETSEYNRFAIEKGDVLIVRTNGNPQYVGRSVVVNDIDEPMVYASYLIRIRCNQSKLRPSFLAEFLNAPSTRQRLRGEVKSSAGNYNINTVGIKKQPICVPKIHAQDEAIDFLRTVDIAISELERRFASTAILKKQLLDPTGGC